jgi:integrase
MFYLGYRATPPKVNRVPAFSMLREDNARKGFLEDAQYQKLMANSPGLSFRAIVEVGRTYGWRIGELKNLKVRHVDLMNRTIRLDPGTTKNREGREVTMTKAIYELLSQCAHAKSGDNSVFTWSNGNSLSDFRQTWANACCDAGVGQLLCPICSVPAKPHNPCSKCGKQWKRNQLKYRGLIFHDLRRTAARNLRRAGVAEGVIMKIGGWRTRSVFERYAIVAQSDVVDAMQKLESRESGHSFGHTEQTQVNPAKDATRLN